MHADCSRSNKVKENKMEIKLRAQSELVPKIQDYNFFIRILGSLHGDCEKEGLSIWVEFDMLMGAFTREK